LSKPLAHLRNYSGEKKIQVKKYK